MSGSRIIIGDKSRLDNVHLGDISREDFLIGSAIPVDEVASDTGIDPTVLSKVISSELSVDADLDLRLGRYFGMSEGFFLRLQNGYDLEEVSRARGLELGRIVRRAA